MDSGFMILLNLVIEYRKLYRSEEPEGDWRASATFDFRKG